MIKKQDFIQAVATHSGVAPKLAEAVLASAGVVAANELRAGGRVRVPGLVNITAKEYGERPGRNLTTGEKCMVPAATRLRASPVASLESAFKAEPN